MHASQRCAPGRAETTTTTTTNITWPPVRIPELAVFGRKTLKPLFRVELSAPCCSHPAATFRTLLGKNACSLSGFTPVRSTLTLPWTRGWILLGTPQFASRLSTEIWISAVCQLSRDFPQPVMISKDKGLWPMASFSGTTSANHQSTASIADPGE